MPEGYWWMRSAAAKLYEEADRFINEHPTLRDRQRGCGIESIQIAVDDDDIANAFCTILWAARDHKGRKSVVELLAKFRREHTDFGSAW